MGAEDLAPNDLVTLARSEPRRAIVVGEQRIGSLPGDHHADRSTVYRAMSIAARTASSLDDSTRLAESAVREAGRAGDVDLEILARVTLAGTLALSGRHPEALALLEATGEPSSPTLRADVRFQKAAVMGRLGQVRRALAALNEALPMFEAMGDRASTAQTLVDRGMLGLLAGDLTSAGADLERAGTIYKELGFLVDLAGVDHNFGLLAARRGDIPEAMRRFNRSESALTELTGSGCDVQVSRVELLLSAGLAHEALALALRLERELTALGLREDGAEAVLAAAQAALACGEVTRALDLARRAGQIFEEQGRSIWKVAALLVEHQSRFAGGDRRLDLMRSARASASKLDEEHQLVPAFAARLLAARVSLERRLLGVAEEELSSLAHVKTGPVELRLQSYLAKALLEDARGNTRGADAAARSGIALLASYQAAIGASDIRNGIQAHGTELIGIGLRLALDSRRPRRVFSWMERGKANALIYRPVMPPDDEELAGELADLRGITARVRSAVGVDAVLMTRQQQELQESIRRRARSASAQRRVDRGPDPATIARAIEPGTLVTFASASGLVWAVGLHNRRFRLVESAPAARVARETESLRFTLRRLARGRGSAATAREVARRLDDLLFGPLRIHDGPLIVVPTSGLHALPWWSLPTCQSRPLTISPSAELWYRSMNSEVQGQGTVVVAGPDLDLSGAEARAVARLYPGSSVLSASRASVQKVQSSMDGANIAHIACHAFFQYENPMFSSLRLADGDLNVYDIERLDSAPEIVVLSACDSGFTDTHAGEELMGLSSALLSMGTKSIIASVGLVPDSHATKDLMVALHRSLVSGLSPSVALHQAQAGVGETPDGFVAASSFICIGAG